MIKNQIQIEFGHGDICVTPAKRKDNKNVALLFANVEPGEIGRHVPADKWDPTSVDAVMIFNNVESIDVVINALKAAKKMLKEKKK